jgi:methionyl-tRNA formyltransferase
MLLKRELDLRGKNAGQVTEQMAELGAKTLTEWLAHPTPPQPQPEEGATYAKKIDKAEARIDWSRTADEIGRQVRAFDPVPGAWFEAAGERVKLLDAECVDGAGVPGQVVGEPLVIACGEDALHCRRLQRAGKGAMDVEDFLRGFVLPVGTILS